MSSKDWPVLLRSPGYRFPPLLPLAPQLFVFPDGLGTMRRAPGSVGHAKNRRSVVRQWVEVAPSADDAPNYGDDSPERRERAPR